MEFLQENTLTGIKVIQNKQEFVIGIFSIRQLQKFARYTKRIIVGYDEENQPIYNKQIQRGIENARVQKIADFLINDPEATFPTNIVLHIPIQAIERQEPIGNGLIKFYLDIKVFEEIEKEKKNEGTGDVYITIIDGQHRIRGVEVAIDRLNISIQAAEKTLRHGTPSQEIQQQLNYHRKRLRDLLDIELVVSFFLDKTLEYQAMIFATINRTQKRVTPSLVYSLFGLSTNDSPHKSALQIVLALNAHPKSPFYNRIKLFGGEYDRNSSPPLSQAMMVKAIIDLISENLRESENDRFRKRGELKKRSKSSKTDLPFRLYYATDEDSKISDILFFYYSAVRDTFIKEDGSSYWSFRIDQQKPENVLQTTVGFQALLLFLTKDVLPQIAETARSKQTSYVQFLAPSKGLPFDDVQRYPFTSKSRSILYLDLSLNYSPAESSEDPRVVKLYQLLHE